MRYALLVCAVLLFFACGVEESAEITFVNKSEHDIENIWGAAYSGIPLLRPGESVTNVVHWYGSSSDFLDLMFYINGKLYGTWITDEEREEAGEAEGYRFQSRRRLGSGEHFTVTVYSEYYWTIKKN
jgi:hypothetical protein